MTHVLEAYTQVAEVIKGFSEQPDLEKYYDIYDISDLDIQDALPSSDNADGEDAESLRALKILAARFRVTRKLFLCALLALDGNGENPDLLRWTAAVEGLKRLNQKTRESYDNLQRLLDQEECTWASYCSWLYIFPHHNPTNSQIVFSIPETPKLPPTPNKERWRSQLRKLNSLSTGIRGLQAKMQLLREESDQTLDDSHDITELGPDLMSQYESIGNDLKDLMFVWEQGKTALAVGIDRTEKRLSSMSMSTLVSPTSSVAGGLATVDGGSRFDAFKILTGESPGTSEKSAEEDPEVFEAVASPPMGPRSTLSREERIIKMKEDREQKAQARQQADATRGMLKELETVISLRPKPRLPRTTNTTKARVVSV